MVQFFKSSPDPREASYGMLAQSLGKGLGEAVNTHYANKALQDVLNDPNLQNAPQSERMGALQRALQGHGPYGDKVFQNQMMVEQQRAQEQEQEVLGRLQAGEELNSKDLSKITPQNQIKAYSLMQKKAQGKSIHSAMIKAGIPKATADMYQNLYENAPIGGQTEIIKAVNDQIRRHKMGKGQEEKPNLDENQETLSIPGIDMNPLPLDFPPENEEMGLTSSDVVKREEKRQALNVPKYDAAIDRLHAAQDDLDDFNYMEELNDQPEALPEGLEKALNVNWETGDIRIPGFASPEAQAFVKTLARQLSRAKNDFPGRVTNFDLEQFKRKFPSLANSREGRKLILQQLKVANRIAFLKDETLKRAYDHYGSSADPMFVRKIADKNYREMRSKLESHLKQLNEKADTMAPNEVSSIESATNLDELFPL